MQMSAEGGLRLRLTGSKVHSAVTSLHLSRSELSNEIKPGPKPKKEDGSDDRRRHVDPPTAPKHPTLPVHDPKKK